MPHPVRVVKNDGPLVAARVEDTPVTLPAIPKNHVWLVNLDADGNEIPGSEFHVNAKAVRPGAVYSDDRKFKKKAV